MPLYWRQKKFSHTWPMQSSDFHLTCVIDWGALRLSRGEAWWGICQAWCPLSRLGWRPPGLAWNPSRKELGSNGGMSKMMVKWLLKIYNNIMKHIKNPATRIFDYGMWYGFENDAHLVRIYFIALFYEMMLSRCILASEMVSLTCG